MPRLLAAALLTLGLAAPAFAQVGLAPDGPVTTNREAVRPTPPPSPVAANTSAARFSAPTDDYGYVAWCFGAVSGYVDQYDKTMPEVTRIERAFPTPSTEENIAKVYPAQRDAAKASLVLYRQAMTAAEKASPRAINQQGAAALGRGRSIWNGYASVTKAQLAQFWMGWTPPADCDTRAKTLQAKSDLFGQALSFNAQPAPEPVAVAAADPEPVEAAPAAPAPVEAPPAKAAPAKAAPAVATSANSSIDSLLTAAASGQGASADLVLRGRK